MYILVHISTFLLIYYTKNAFLKSHKIYYILDNIVVNSKFTFDKIRPTHVFLQKTYGVFNSRALDPNFEPYLLGLLNDVTIFGRYIL